MVNETAALPDCKNIEEAMIRAAEIQGFAVVAISATETVTIYPGDKFHSWGGYSLPDGYSLIVARPSNQEEWDAQWKLLLPTRSDKNAHGKTSRYFRCIIRARGKALMKKGQENGW